jgi:hypothetical protein
MNIHQWASIGNSPFASARGAWGARSRPPISNALTRPEQRNPDRRKDHECTT